MKKVQISGLLSIEKESVYRLNNSQMGSLVGGVEPVNTDTDPVEGPKRSRRLNSDCVYSRNHLTQCDSDSYSRASVCICETE